MNHDNGTADEPDMMQQEGNDKQCAKSFVHKFLSRFFTNSKYTYAKDQTSHELVYTRK